MFKKLKNVFFSLSIYEKYFLALTVIVLTGLTIFTFTEANLSFDSDTATANLLAEEIVRAKSFFPPDWQYGQDIWIFFLHIPIAIMTLFSDNYLGMHSVSAILFISLAVVSCIYFSRKVLKNNAWLVALPLLFCGLSVQYSLFVFGQCAYIVPLIYTFFAPALFCESLDENFHIKSYPKFVFLLLFIVFIGLSGTRYIQAISIPIVGAMFLLYLINNHNKEIKTIKDSLISVTAKLLLLVLAVGVGLLLFFIIQYSVNFISGDTVIFFLDPDQIVKQIYHIVMSLAYLLDVLPSVPLFSVSGIMNILNLFTAVLFLLVFPILQIKKFKEESQGLKFFILFFAIHTAEIVILALFTELMTETTSRYWLPVEFMLLFLSAHYIYKYILSKPKAFGALVITCVLTVCIEPATFGKLSSFVGYSEKMSNKTAILECLKENDLERGYATYWNAGVYTALSNGKIEINSVETKIRAFNWLNSYARYSDEVNPGKTFLMLTESENASLAGTDTMKRFGEPENVISAHGYVIYVYNYNIARNGFAGFGVLGELTEPDGDLQNTFSSLTAEYDTDKFFIFDESKYGVYTVGLPGFNGDASEYELENLLLIPTESEKAFPDKYRYAYKYLKTENGYNIYYGEINVFDIFSGLPNDGLAIDLPTSDGIITQNGEFSDGVFITNGTEGTVLYGPYANTATGTYEFTLHYEIVSSENDYKGRFTITTDAGQFIHASTELNGSSDYVTVTAAFGKYDGKLEYHLLVPKNMVLKIKYIEIRKISD